MTITKTAASKLFVGFVAIAMALSLFAPAQAQTESELQAQIDSLMATINSLQSQLGGTTVSTGGSSASVCPYAWTRSLSTGSTGADVMALQQFLNADAATQVAAAGSAGSAGMETDYYGPATAAAVSNFQVMHRDAVLTPNGLVNPTGYFGPSSIAQANALCASAPVMDDSSDDSSDDSDDSDMSLSGEGVLETFEIDDDETEVQEGAEDEVVMVLTMEANDGDVRVDRLTMQLIADDANANMDQDPWDNFDEVSLWVDGEKIASFEADDEDEYLDEDEGTFRFSNLGLVLEEDEEVEVEVAVSTANSVDGADDPAGWNIDVLSGRTFDADGVADTGSFDEMGDEDATDGAAGDYSAITDGIDFDIVVEGIDDDAEINGNSSNPDSTTLDVEDDTTESDEFVVHVFDIEVDRDSSDLNLDDAFADVTIVNTISGATISGQDAVIDGIFMTIDGQTEEGEAVTGAADAESANIASSTVDADGTTVRYRFEFDGFELESDTDYEAEISVIFEGTDNGTDYPNMGVEITTAVDGTIWEVEGLDSDNVLTGTDSSEDHTLTTADATITNHDWSVASAGNFLDFTFTVEAGDEDFDVLLADFDYATTGTAAAYAPTLTRTSGDADTVVAGSEYDVLSDDTASFRIRFDLSGTNGQYLDVTATSIAGQPIPDDEEVSPTATLNIAS